MIPCCLHPPSRTPSPVTNRNRLGGGRISHLIIIFLVPQAALQGFFSFISFFSFIFLQEVNHTLQLQITITNYNYKLQLQQDSTKRPAV